MIPACLLEVPVLTTDLPTDAIYLSLAMIFLIVVAGIHLRTLHTSSIDKAFERQYKSLVIITLAFVTLGAATLTTLIFETAMGRSIITQSIYAEAGALLPPYMYVFFGLPLSLFLLSRSFRNGPQPQRRRRARSVGAASETGKSSFGQNSFVIPTQKRPAPSSFAPPTPHVLSLPRAPSRAARTDGGGGAQPASPEHWLHTPSSAAPSFIYPPPPASYAARAPESVVVMTSQQQFYPQHVTGGDEQVKWTKANGWLRSNQ